MLAATHYCLSPSLGRQTKQQHSVYIEQIGKRLSELGFRWRHLDTTAPASLITAQIRKQLLDPGTAPQRIIRFIRHARPQPGLTPDLIPAVIPPEQYAHIQHHLPGTAELTGRTFVSLCLVHTTPPPPGGWNWKRAGETLGINPKTATATGTVLTCRIENPNRYFAEIHELGTQLLTNPVNWGDQRRRYANHTTPSEQGLTAHAETRPRITDTLKRNVAIHEWVQHTNGDYRQSPAFTKAIEDGHIHETIVEMYRRFRIRN